jgi:hypothetical protein
MEVTYYVALPFVGADDSIAARSPLVAAEIRRQAISGMQR